MITATAVPSRFLESVMASQHGVREEEEECEGQGRRELITTLQSLDITQLVITHDLPLALELCPRSIIMDAGLVVADDATSDLLSDEALLAAHRLEMPFGYPRTQA